MRQLRLHQRLQLTPGAPAAVTRPLQYLGSKLRSLPAIRQAVAGRAAGRRAVDLFTGSTVVAQALADDGFTVEAYDALALCATAARATLGVGRGGEDLREVGARLLERAAVLRDDDLLRPWIDLERDALAAADGDALLRIGAEVPQIWRPHGANGRLAETLGRMTGGAPADRSRPVASTHYAGTYLGLAQAVQVDALRRAVADEALGPWATDAALTALVAAISAAAFTPGKHFAQPHRVHASKDLAFHRQRALTDRGVDICARFLAALGELAARPSRGADGHLAAQRTVESWRALGRPDGAPPVDLVYADPPYTAQQYGRFYHLPEVIVTDRIPRLQVHRGRITAGLYPEGRFRSRFCSKRQAPAAFDDLFDLAASWGAEILVSYAGSASGHTGNDRMIGLDALVDRCRAHFREVTVLGLDHAYRQLNHAGAAVGGRQDVEVLVHGSRPC